MSQQQLTLPLGPAASYRPVGPRLWDVFVGGEGDWSCPCSGKCGVSSWTGQGQVIYRTPPGAHVLSYPGGVLCLLGPTLQSTEVVGLTQLLW